ncbi:MAG: PLP-dependent aminotransferase family protein [Acidobacteria bacterium]|nr:PLP-dependent aminotransferase family protein [Acidobacteriota bacterium]
MKVTRLSAYGQISCQPSPANRMMAEFASGFRDGVDINLGVGYVNEETIPAMEIRRALDCVLDNPAKYRQSLNYGGAAGSDNLIDSIRRYMAANKIGGLTDEVLARCRIIIGPNGASSLLESLAHVLPQGIVVTSDPTYYIFINFLERRGFQVLAVPEDDEGIRIDLLDEKLGALGDRLDEITFFYVVTINNPSCAILSNRRRRELIRAASLLSQRLGRRIPLILDRAYEELVHDPEVGTLESGLLSDRHGIVYEIGTLSKVLAPALRIGYMIGQDGSFMEAMVQRTFDAGFSAALINQEMASWLLDHRIGQQLDRVRAGYRRKAEMVRSWVDEYLGDELETASGGRAGFYFYLTLRSVETGEGSRFFRYLTRTTGDPDVDGPADAKGPRVIYIPGEICVHPRGDLAEAGRRQLRISYAFEDLDALRRAMALMKEAIEYARRD